MVPTAATPSRSRSAPVVGREPLTGPVALVTVVVVPGPVPFGLPPGLPAGAHWLPWQPRPQSLPWQLGPQSSPTAVAARPAASENTAVFAVHDAHGRTG